MTSVFIKTTDLLVPVSVVFVVILSSSSILFFTLPESTRLQEEEQTQTWATSRYFTLCRRKTLLLKNELGCDSSAIHIATTLDEEYFRGTVALINSVLQNSLCPENIFFHLIFSGNSGHLLPLIRYIFPSLKFKACFFDTKTVEPLILPTPKDTRFEVPLNYARYHLADLLVPSIHRVLYLDPDVIVVDDIYHLWKTTLGKRKTVGSPEFCHLEYFTALFTEEDDPRSYSDPPPCYFNPGVMVIDLASWRKFHYTMDIKDWMKSRKSPYGFTSIPIYLDVFAGEVAPVEQRWNRFGLGAEYSCSETSPNNTASLLHWSGKSKPWVRLNAGKPCPIDLYWSKYDLC